MNEEHRVMRVRPRVGRFTSPRAWMFVVGVAAILVAAIAGEVLVVTVPVSKPDAIFSLTGHEWERLPSTAAIAQMQPAAVVLLSAPEQVTKYNCNDCAHRVQNLADAGVPIERIHVLPVRGNGTYWEAEAVQQYLKEHRLKRLLVVTSPYHTLRAYSTFAKVLSGTGVAVGVQPAWKNSGARPWLWWSRYGDLRYVSYEWAAVASYMPRYGIYPQRSGVWQ